MTAPEQDDDVMRCVVCGSSVTDDDSGLCDKHKYDEQRAESPDERVIVSYPVRGLPELVLVNSEFGRAVLGRFLSRDAALRYLEVLGRTR